MNNNHETSREYECLVEQFVRQGMDGISGVEGLEIKRDAMLTGVSGHTHQIDVCYRFRVWRTDFLVLIECKQYQKKVGIEDLLAFRGRLEDLRAHKGVFVTAVGYQKGALEYAKANRIALLIVRENQVSNTTFSLSRLYTGTKSILTSEEIEKERFEKAVEKILTFKRERMRCQKQAEELKEAFNLTENLSERFAVTKDAKFISISSGGATILIKPGELAREGKSQQLSDFRGSWINTMLEGHPLGALKPSALLKLHLAEILLTLSLDPNQAKHRSWWGRLSQWIAR